jgi:hypothetical protein
VPKQLWGNKNIKKLRCQHAGSFLRNIRTAVVLLLYAAASRAFEGPTAAIAADLRPLTSKICVSKEWHAHAGVQATWLQQYCSSCAVVAGRNRGLTFCNRCKHYDVCLHNKVYKSKWLHKPFF